MDAVEHAIKPIPVLLERIAELEAERDSLIAANVVLREAMKDIHDTTFNQSLQSLINMALTQPVTTEALERVRREAQVKIERLKRDWRGYYDELPPPPEGV